MSDIFLSYAREDHPRAMQLCHAFEAEGWSVWWDRTDLPAGSTFDDVIEKALKASRCVVVLWSKHSVASRWVRTEAGEGANKILVPVLIEEAVIPFAFRRIQAADFTDWDGDRSSPNFRRLADDLADLLGAPDQPPLENPLGERSPSESASAESERSEPNGRTLPSNGGQSRQVWYKRTPIMLALIAGVFGLLATIVTIYLGNNGGGGSSPARRPVVASFEVEPNAIARGEMASLAWRVENAEGAVIEPDVGAVALEGSWSVQPDETTVYRIVARSAETSVQAAAALNVLSPPDPVSPTEPNPPAAATPPIISRFSVSPDRVEAGASATLAWTVANADSVAISPGVGSKAVRGSQIVSPAKTTVYTLEAKGEGGRRVAIATVNVTQEETSPIEPASTQTPPPTVSQFRAGPDTIKAGEKTTLGWSVSGTDSVDIQPDIGKVRPQGSLVVSPSKSTVYRLTATSGDQTVRAAARVTVEPATVMQKALLRLEKIQTFEDGSGGTTRWSFEVRSGGQRLFVLPQRRYSDRSGANVYEPSDGTSAIVTPEADGSIELEVKGSRTGSSSANAVADGKGTVSLVRGAARFKVANARKPDEGSFVFYFSLKKLSSTYLPNLRRTLQVARPN